MAGPLRHLHTRVMLACAGAVVVSVGTTGLMTWSGRPLAAAAAAGTAAGLAVGVVMARRALRPARQALRALHDGVVGFAESEFATRVASPASDELDALVTLFNRMGDVLRRERASLAQRELLLDTLLQGAPMAIVLLGLSDRVVFANQAARRLLGHPTRMTGETFGSLVSGAPEGLHDALHRLADSLVSWDHDGQDETWRLLVRPFTLHTVPHRLLVVERLTADLARQEVRVWKKAIRVMSHEINNSLAPVSSLAHSAGIVARRPDASERLPPILDAIAERVALMTRFLEGYARFARLPAPQPEEVDIRAFLDGLRPLFPGITMRETPATVARFDPGQIQQVLINLVKNAREAGSSANEVTLEAESAGDGLTFVVADRGHGMSAEQMRTALLPFHSSKKAGGGLGLSLCAEIVDGHRGRLSLARRDAGGMTVRVWLPYASDSDSSSSASGTG